MTSIAARRFSRRRFTAAGAASLAVPAAIGTGRPVTRSMAQVATPLPAGANVVADALVNPRHLAIAADGTIYVTEAGVGGDGLLGRGYSGRVSRIAADGTVSALVDGLVSYAEGVGPSGIMLRDEMLFFALGGVAVDREQQPLPEENTVNRIDPGGGPALIAELGVFEVAENPDGADVSTNLYGMAPRADGSLVIVDAGANVMYGVDPDSGEFALLNVVPNLTILSGRQPAASEGTRQAVPTAVAVDADDVVHVSLLSQRWPADGPSVVTVGADGTFTPVLRGGSMIVSMAFGPDGALYVSQLLDAYGNDSPIGSVRRVRSDTTSEAVVDGLTQPHGIAFDAAGNLFVATNALLSTAGAAVGQILRIDDVAPPS